MTELINVLNGLIIDNNIINKLIELHDNKIVIHKNEKVYKLCGMCNEVLIRRRNTDYYYCHRSSCNDLSIKLYILINDCKTYNDMITNLFKGDEVTIDIIYPLLRKNLVDLSVRIDKYNDIIILKENYF